MTIAMIILLSLAPVAALLLYSFNRWNKSQCHVGNEYSTSLFVRHSREVAGGKHRQGCALLDGQTSNREETK